MSLDAPPRRAAPAARPAQRVPADERPLQRVKEAGDRGRQAQATELARVARRCFERNELSVHAAAITYQVLFSLVPLTLFSLSLLGFLDLRHWWTQVMSDNVK